MYEVSDLIELENIICDNIRKDCVPCDTCEWLKDDTFRKELCCVCAYRYFKRRDNE